MKKKVLLVSHSSGSTGGAEDDFVSLLKFISDKPDEYTIHVISPKGIRSSEYASYASKHGNLIWGFLPVIYVSWWHYFKYFMKFFIQAFQLIRFIGKTHYDICIVNVVVLIWPVIILKMFRFKVIVMIKETIEPERIRRKIYKFLSYFADHFIPNSKIIENEYKKITGKLNISTVYSAVIDVDTALELEENDIESQIEPNSLVRLKDTTTFKLFCIGNIKKIKNQQILLKALLRNEGLPFANQIELFLIGDTEEEKEYYEQVKYLIEENGLSNRVFFLGRLNRALTITMYKFMDALVISSVSEGVPLVLVYAFKFKKFIITTSVGGIPDVVKNGFNGFLVNNVEIDFANAIKYLFLHKDELKYIRENGYRTYLEKFNWLNNMNQIEGIIKHVAESAN